MNQAIRKQGRFVQPEIVSSHFHIREGDQVADFGAGSGFFVPTLSRLVGEEGVVYAVEVQKNLVEKIAETMRHHNLVNVQPLWGDIEEVGGTEIADASLDCAIVVNTLFQVEDKAGTIAEVSRTLRSGGKLFVIDWSESFEGLGPQPGDVLTGETAKAIVETAGFVYEQSFDAGDHHYGFGYRKP